MIRHGIMDQYKAPPSEHSIFKTVPMSLRHHPFVKGMLAVGCQIRYRGPREGWDSHTKKRNATHFSIYPPSPRREYYQGPDNRWHGHTFWPWEKSRYNSVT